MAISVWRCEMWTEGLFSCLFYALGFLEEEAAAGAVAQGSLEREGGAALAVLGSVSDGERRVSARLRDSSVHERFVWVCPCMLYVDLSGGKRLSVAA